MTSSLIDALERRIHELEEKLREQALVHDEAIRVLSEHKLAEVQSDRELISDPNVYQRVVNLTPFGIAYLDHAGKILFVNATLAEMLGNTPEEVCGLLIGDICNTEEMHDNTGSFYGLASEETCSPVIIDGVLSKSNDRQRVSLEIFPLLGNNGSAIHSVCFIRPLEKVDKTVLDAKESDARLKAVLDSLSEGVVVYSHEGQVLEINPAAMELLGYRREEKIEVSDEALGQMFEVTSLDGVPLPHSEWPVSKFLRGESVSDDEFHLRRIDSGRALILSVSGKVIADKRPEAPIGVFTLRDITTRRKAELALRMSEERLRLALDNIPDMIVIYDRDMRVRYLNVETRRTIGPSVGALVGRKIPKFGNELLLLQWERTVSAALHSGEAQAEDLDVVSGSGLRNYALTCVPICEADGKVREVMAICHDFTERRQAEERVRFAALHDPLTGLPNRTLLFEYAKHIFSTAKRLRQKIMVMFIDLDRFKAINDLYGHEVGDDVLRQAAGRLKASMRADDFVVRLGGDEFLTLLPHHLGSDAGDYVARHLLSVISKPYNCGSLELTLSCSIGAAIYPDDSTEVDILINYADAAMYQAKKSGRNAYRPYTSDLAERVYTQSVIEQNIKEGLQRNEFCLHYQPLVDMETNTLVSVEALLRWPANGMGPDRFVQIAESTGLIERLGDWVISEACRQHNLWLEEGLPAIPIAINVSSMQFRKKNFTSEIDDALARHHVEPSAIQIELTETAVMEDIDHAITILQHLRRKGMKVSLDDFGTGYSSLNYLSRLPLDKIKVDKSFVHRVTSDSASRAITEAIIALGRTLDLEIVAEGIESDLVLQYLKNHGCHQAQGYFVCKPVLGDALACWYRMQAYRGQRH